MTSAALGQTLGMIVHAHSGSGKSWLGSTTPGPRLILDSEGGSRFTPGTKVTWDPMREAPPPAPGTEYVASDGQTYTMAEWDTCIVLVRDFATMERTYEWLNSGAHPFESLVVDSLTEVQKRLQDSIAGTEQMKTQDWGALLRKMEALVRKMRDLTFHPVKPLSAVVLLAITSDRGTGNRFKPHVQGQLSISLPYFMDVVGYLYVETEPTSGQRVRRLLVQPTEQYEAKDRTNRLPAVVDIADLNGYDGSSAQRVGVTAMLDTIYGTG